MKAPSFGISAPMRRMESQKAGAISASQFLQKNPKHEGIDKALEQKEESFPYLFHETGDRRTFHFGCSAELYDL